MFPWLCVADLGGCRPLDLAALPYAAAIAALAVLAGLAIGALS